MRYILKDTPKNRARIEALPKIYSVEYWTEYWITAHYFSGKYTTRDGKSIPLVYKLENYNGLTPHIRLMPITQTTSSTTLVWTQEKKVAAEIATALNRVNATRRR